SAVVRSPSAALWLQPRTRPEGHRRSVCRGFAKSRRAKAPFAAMPSPVTGQSGPMTRDVSFPLSTASAINATAPSLQRKDIDRAALRHLGILAGEQQIHARLHLGRVDAPTGLHRDVLLAVYLERCRHRCDPRDGRELPEDFSSLSIEGA